MSNKVVKFEPNNFYHIVNHAIANENLFLEETNYNFFLKKYLKYLPLVSSTYAYCLMLNHIHFLIKTHSEKDLLVNKKFKGDFHKLIANEISNTLNSYAKAYNKVYKRRGSLWVGSTKRFLIKNEKHLKTVIKYIHLNPVNHNFCSHPDDWEFSSFKTIIQDSRSFIKKDEIIGLFDGKDGFIQYHRNKDVNDLLEPF